MKAKDLRNLSEKELKAKVKELRKELSKEYAQVAMKTMPKNPGKIKATRRLIARILTILNEKRKK